MKYISFVWKQPFFNQLNNLLDKAMPLLTPIGVTCGFMFPDSFIKLKPYVPWLFAVMTLSGAIKLRFAEMKAAIGNPRPIISFFIAAHIIMPFLAFVFGTLFNPQNHDIAAGFVLLFAIPTAVSGFIWNSIFSGLGALSLTLIVLDTLLAPLIVPFTISILLGPLIVFSLSGMALSLIGMVVIPTIIGISVHELTNGSIPKAVGDYLGVISKLFLLLVIAANTSAVAPKVSLNSPGIWLIALQGIGLSASGFILGKLTGFFAHTDEQSRRTLVFSVGLRNISAAATLAIAFFPEQAALPAILGMIFQQTLASFSGRILLGSPEKIRQEQDNKMSQI